MEIKNLEQKLKKIFSDKLNCKENHLFTLTLPPSHIKADFSTNFPLILSKEVKKNPIEMAKEISDILNSHNIKNQIAGNGFINITLDDFYLFDFAKKFLSEQNYFFNSENQKENIIIEFVSANPTGPLHLASGSGATLGDSLARIMSKCGYRIFKEYYVNDKGNQIKNLGLSLKARYLGSPIPENGYYGEYLNDIAKELPPEAKSWTDDKFSSFAMEKIINSQKKDLEDFRVNFDNWFYESELHKKQLPLFILEKLKQSQTAYKKDNAWWFGNSDDKEDDKDRVLVKSDGQNTYFLNDLAYHFNKYERGFNRIIDIWGADHHGYIQRMKNGIKAIGKNPDTFQVIIHQLVSIKKGQQLLKMSKRAGEFITLKELIEDIGVDAARFFFSMRSPNTHLIFDLELARKKTNENPVYYVQYVHARINSILENAKKAGINIDEIPDIKDYKLNEDERNLLIKVMWLERILELCIKDLTPHHLNIYLQELAKVFHSFYDKHKVIDNTNLIQTKIRLMIIKTVKLAIKTGLELLGVSSPDKM